MNDEELIDDLISEEYTQAWLYWAHIPTDDEHVWMTEQLILDTDGNIIARNICPPWYGSWSRVIWSLRPALYPIPNSVMDIDLTDREASIAIIQIFGHP
ncbi:hypothetical protein BV921_19020 [Pectobacterium odoriferum]|uniref:hypothetical protein n=1 Tax=Pectobacterium TaxID=122277 RepID=UPI000CD237B1|nr:MULTISPECIES: hypothetical protein [Pectobacterium]POE07493.1 hypothetical protein BV921_19020 [Pectobacterium odoriferum]TKY80175.1 hypothetical protein EDI29_22545 [Pectobacterium polonicum]